MDFKDYYKIIGVSKTASQDEIKRAYKKLARKYHPDVSKVSNAEVRFKELGEAYEALKDPEKRAAYDHLAKNWKAGQDFKAQPDWDAGFEFRGGGYTGSDASGYSDFFDTLFGQDFGSTQQKSYPHTRYKTPGEDHHAKILIDLEDAYHGATRSITLQTPEVDYSGHVYTKQRILNVKIPKGVKQGQRIRLSGQGSHGTENSPAGDLYLEIEFKPHGIYKVDGHDVYLELPLTPWEAALGAKVKVPTPNGFVDLKISEGTLSEQRLRLKGRGIPGNPPGDLYVITKISLPPANTIKAKELYLKMQQELKYNPRSQMGM